MTTATTPALTHKYLIDDQLWGQLVGFIAREENLEQSLAARIMDQALGLFRVVAADARTGSPHHAPSTMVDIGVHAFILHTQEFAEFGTRLTGGGVIHHRPWNEEELTIVDTNGVIAQTVAAMKAHGFAVDEPLWDTVEDYEATGSYLWVQ